MGRLEKKTFAFQDPGAIGPFIFPLALEKLGKGRRFVLLFE
jgi:hypothetical protein